MGAGDAAFERSRLASERIARLKRDLAPLEPHAPGGTGRAGQGVLAAPASAGHNSHLVAEKLAQLAPYGWFLLHDVHWPGRPLARLELVLVGPGGVVVVNAKNWSGDVEVVDGALRQNGHDRFPAVETALAQAAAVTAVLPAPWRRLVRSLICLTAQPELQGTTGSGIEVRGIDCIAAAVTNLPDVLDAPSALLLYTQLGQLLTRPQMPEACTVQNPVYHPATGRPATSRPVQRRPVPPHYLYGRERRPVTVLRVVGRSLVAGLVSAALLAPPLWLMWELLPK
jgi:hypothetical protein